MPSNPIAKNRRVFCVFSLMATQEPTKETFIPHLLLYLVKMITSQSTENAFKENGAQYKSGY